MGPKDITPKSDLVLKLVGGQGRRIRPLWGVQAAMKIHVVGPRAEMGRLDPEARVVHLTYHPTALVFLELLKRCPRLEAIQVPPSRINNVSKPSRCLLKVQKVKIFEGLIWGHRTDRSEYYTVDERAILQRAGQLRGEGLDPKEIAARVAEEAKVSPGLVGFIIGR